MTTHPADRDWFKSSRSANNAACVEIRVTAGTIGVRDSKDQPGPILTFGTTAWTDFLTTLPQLRG